MALNHLKTHITWGTHYIRAQTELYLKICCPRYVALCCWANRIGCLPRVNPWLVAESILKPLCENHSIHSLPESAAWAMSWDHRRGFFSSCHLSFHLVQKTIKIRSEHCFSFKHSVIRSQSLKAQPAAYGSLVVRRYKGPGQCLLRKCALLL